MNKDKDDAVAQGTPRTDANRFTAIPSRNTQMPEVCDADFARQLEREVAALSAQVVAQGTKEATFFADAPNPPDAPPRRTEVEALRAQLRENLIRSVEIASEKDERIEKLSAQVVELQHYVKNLQTHREAAEELVDQLVNSTVTRASVPPKR